ncbi:PREDICTED: uncharacterized protein LOC109222315 [Nicotiana attenuata]|uniref:uncharacterized protein LOC109216474 n=1 Tax=Nicotiana attenuata TaxID=49451 RepID=UPI000905C97D|nr:PREDICTED: uncharacterized protein LOC109216474 [Nicotiana attenuata]XP_019242224.1 PREDICTED: uncharacterized protein LOC109222315 [Nicotiana attenuata]
MELEKWLIVEESVWTQKSRVQWLKLGDSNTSYFYACMKNRQARNHIGKLTSCAGHLLHSADEVAKEILTFYKVLLGTAATQLLVVLPDVMQNGYTLNHRQQLQLIHLVIREEIKQAITDIDDNNTLGCDGYNAHLFKKTWHILGDEVTDAVMDFFQTAAMYKAINRTTITLIPKVKNPANMSLSQYLDIQSSTS